MKLNPLGKTAFVAGGSVGIGLTCAKTLLRMSVRALTVARGPQRWQCAVESIGFEKTVKKRWFSVESANLTRAQDVRKVVEAFKRIKRMDVIINREIFCALEC
jgi:NAD(P)-dependent dehydrogenase (short-subunit alcohol dehydrogenase family)